MDKAINTTLIIGNGFDINMGKHTGYAEFFKKLEDEGFWENHSGNSLLNFIGEKGSKEYWYDFEDIILHYTFESGNGKRLKELEDLNKTDDNFTNGIVSEVKEGMSPL